MKKIYISIICIVFLFASCKQNVKDICVIDGKITNLSNPELYIVSGGQDSLIVDTVICSKDGSFSFETKIDGFAPIVIYLDGGKALTMVWMENQKKITLSGNAAYPELISVKGGETNDFLTGFKEKNYDVLKQKRDLIDRRDAIDTEDSLVSNVINESQYASKILNLNYVLKDKTEAFITKNPEKFASLVLFQDFIMTWGEPEEALNYFNQIKGDITQTTLYNNLKDELDEIIKNIRRTEIGAVAPDFSIVALNKKDTINLDLFKDKYLLLTFSASWCDFCQGNYKELIQVREKVKESKLGMLTISLDEDKAAWEELVKREKLDWYQSVDTMGWESSLAYLYNINKIPVNYLIDSNKVIVGRNLTADELINLMEN